MNTLKDADIEESHVAQVYKVTSINGIPVRQTRGVTDNGIVYEPLTDWGISIEKPKVAYDNISLTALAREIKGGNLFFERGEGFHMPYDFINLTQETTGFYPGSLNRNTMERAEGLAMVAKRPLTTTEFRELCSAVAEELNHSGENKSGLLGYLDIERPVCHHLD
jgi:hypothetical protein